MDMDIKVNYDAFQEEKRMRIEELRKPLGEPPRTVNGDDEPSTDQCVALPAGNTAPLVSAPTNHEVAGFMPGRLEFEHEVENEAEMPVKDMEFGLVFRYGGDQQPQAKVTIVKPADDEEEEEEDEDEAEDEEAKEGDDEGEVKVKKEEEDNLDVKPDANGDTKNKKGKQKAKPADDDNAAAAEQLVEIEDEDELDVKLALLDIYFSKLDRREDAKDLIFDRGLTEYKKVSCRKLESPRQEGATGADTMDRSRQTRGKDLKTSGSWSTGTRCLPSCRRPWTTSLYWRVLSVSQPALR